MTIMIIGGTGFVGSHIIKRFYNKFDLIIFSRDEYKQYNLKKEYPNSLFITGNIKEPIPYMKKRPDLIINCAAMKHVIFCNDNPFNAVKTNILGLQNIINYCLEYDIRLIHMSSDKAVEPINCYGATKFIGDCLLENANKIKPLFLSIRCGNIWGSRGSVIPLIKKLKGDDTFEISSMEAERYFLHIDVLIAKIEWYIKSKSVGLVPIYSKKARIKDIIKAWNQNIKIFERGLFPGEKVKEKLEIDETNNSVYYAFEELTEMLNV